MFNYSIIQILAFFYFYCLFGWCFESTYVSINSKKFVNRGFLRGPWVPIYGVGAFVMLYVTKPVEGSLPLVFLVGMFGATMLELITGMVMESLFKVRYWDYSDEKFNFKGQICLSTSIAWGGLSIFLIAFFHKVAEKLVFSISDNNLKIIVYMITIVFIVDTTLSIKAALDIAEIIRIMEQSREDAKYEVARMHKRLDVYVAVAGDVKDGIMDEIERKIHAKGEQIKRYGMNDFYKRSMIKGNPTMISKKFTGTVEEIRSYLNTHRKKDKDKKTLDEKENKEIKK
jgi:uncharacterized membrane protein